MSFQNFSRAQLRDFVKQHRPQFAEARLPSIDLRRSNAYIRGALQDYMSILNPKPLPVPPKKTKKPLPPTPVRRSPFISGRDAPAAYGLKLEIEKIANYANQDPARVDKIVRTDIAKYESEISKIQDPIFTIIIPSDTKQSVQGPFRYKPEALIGWLRNYISHVGEYTEPEVFINFYERGSPKNQPEFELWTNTSSENCVYKLLQNQNLTKAQLDSAKKIMEKHNITGDKNTGLGVNKTIVKEIYEAKSGIRLVVKNILGAVWYDPDTTNSKKRRTVIITAHDEHALPYEAILEFPTKVTYVDDVSFKALTLDSEKIGYELVEDKDDLVAVKVGDTIYKKQFPMETQEDLTNSDYFNCFTEESYQYRKWKKENRLRAPTNVYFDIAKQADAHLTSQKFIQYTPGKTQAHGYDMNKAFPSFKTNKLYEIFGIPINHMSLYNHHIQNVTPSDLMFTGFVYVTNVKHIGEQGRFIFDIDHIVNDHWYTTLRIYNAVKQNYITTDITQIVLAKKEDLKFPFDHDLNNKKINNAFIGRLISGASDKSKKIVTRKFTCNNADELSYIQHTLEQQYGTTAAVYDNRVTAFVPLSTRRNQLHQIHSFIIDYQQTTFVNKMIECLDYKIISYNTDGFFTQLPVPEKIVKPSLNPGEFKYTGKNTITWDASFTRYTYAHPVALPQTIPTYDNRPHTDVTLITGPAGCGKSYKYIYQEPRVGLSIGFPTNKLVADCIDKFTQPTLLKIENPVQQTAVPLFHGPTTGSVEYMCRLLNEIEECNSSISQSSTLPSSEGQTEQLEEPENSNEPPTPKVYITTIHKLFDLCKTKKPAPLVENIVVDEVSLISYEHLSVIANYCHLNRVNLILIGDVDSKTAWSNQRGVIETKRPTFNFRNVFSELTFSEIQWEPSMTEPRFRRQANPEHWDFIQSLRDKDQATQLELLIANPLVTKIADPNEFKKINNPLGISSTHANIYKFNALLDDPSTTQVPARCMKTTKDKDGNYIETNGSLKLVDRSKVWFGRKKASDKSQSKYEAAYFVTSDMIQGTSVAQPIIVDTTDMMKGFLYTAVSRCRDLSNVYLYMTPQDKCQDQYQDYDMSEYEI